MHVSRVCVLTVVVADPPESGDGVLGDAPGLRCRCSGVGHQLHAVEPGVGADCDGLGSQGDTGRHHAQGSQQTQGRPDHDASARVRIRRGLGSSRLAVSGAEEPHPQFTLDTR
ncbi:hypothetical protein CEXT_689861 [Caerostris extrusa]|uniref:Secreted protein n=1 Tax=Caerostris extrusa TaxID=172846 RepID=A0AAV4TC66_CAEEX|nr:hypothetical protein CEXT_689861 [Caerostris extrusa]